MKAKDNLEIDSKPGLEVPHEMLVLSIISLISGLHRDLVLIIKNKKLKKGKGDLKRHLVSSIRSDNRGCLSLSDSEAP